MAVLSSSALLRALSIFHLTLAYYLLTTPSILAEQNLVIILGAAMDIPLPSETLSTPSSATGFAALLLIVIAFFDITAPGVEDEVGGAYWSSQAPMRVALFFVVTGGVYLGKFGLEEGKKKARLGGGSIATSIMKESLCNSFVFSWAFMEMLLWFWVSQSWAHSSCRAILVADHVGRYIPQ